MKHLLLILAMSTLASSCGDGGPCYYNETQIRYTDEYGNTTGYGCVETQYYLDNSELFLVDNGVITQKN